jgi:hypothetical protein
MANIIKVKNANGVAKTSMIITAVSITSNIRISIIIKGSLLDSILKLFSNIDNIFIIDYESYKIGTYIFKADFIIFKFIFFIFYHVK